MLSPKAAARRALAVCSAPPPPCNQALLLDTQLMLGRSPTHCCLPCAQVQDRYVQGAGKVKGAVTKGSQPSGVLCQSKTYKYTVK